MSNDDYYIGDEKIPPYLSGYCECDGRKVYYNQRIKGTGSTLLTCHHPSMSEKQYDN